MINFYNIILDNNGIPTLSIVKQYDYNNKDVSIEDMVEFLNMSELCSSLYNEHSYIVGYNIKNDVLGIFQVSIGDSQSCHLYKKEALMFLLLIGANKVSVFHNHPSNILQASENDVFSMCSFELYLKDLNIEFIDSIIICKSGWLCVKSKERCEYDEEDCL